jgi:lipase maturation factor
MWFAAMPGAETPLWLVRMVARLLEGDRAVRGLLAPGPFPDRPPRWIRGRYYRYQFTTGGEPGWRRTLVGEYLPPLSATSPELTEALARAPEW